MHFVTNMVPFLYHSGIRSGYEQAAVVTYGNIMSYQEGKVSEQEKKLNEVIARVWKDEKYKQKLVADPKGTLAEAGLQFPSDVRIKVHMDTADTLNLVIPTNPADAELSDGTLDAVAGGSGYGDTCALSTCPERC